MLRTPLVALVVLALSQMSPSDLTLGGGRPAFAPPPCSNQLQQEPVLVWDHTGSTLTGPYHSRLSVYSNGLATVSSVVGFESAGNAATAFVPPAAVQALRQALMAAGAATLCDQQSAVADVPLTTVTFFLGGTDARARTFSYWLGTNEYAAVSTIVSDFRGAFFPGS
jgi:hypothetical protein